jgi:hypothetical protein
MTREPDSHRFDDSFRESHASDGTAFGHVGQPSTPIDDEIERGAKWEMLALRWVEGDYAVTQAVGRFGTERINLRQKPFDIEAQGEYAAARNALDKMAGVDAAATGDGDLY